MLFGSPLLCMVTPEGWAEPGQWAPAPARPLECTWKGWYARPGDKSPVLASVSEAQALFENLAVALPAKGPKSRMDPVLISGLWACSAVGGDSPTTLQQVWPWAWGPLSCVCWGRSPPPCKALWSLWLHSPTSVSLGLSTSLPPQTQQLTSLGPSSSRQAPRWLRCRIPSGLSAVSSIAAALVCDPGLTDLVSLAQGTLVCKGHCATQ